MSSTTRSQIALGFFGITLVVSLFLISRTIDNQKRCDPCESATPTPTPTSLVEEPFLSDSWTQALAARLHNAVEEWSDCPALGQLPTCWSSVTAQADSILGDLGGHAPYSRGAVPEEGTDCWQRLNQLSSAAEYMARLKDEADYQLAQLHYNIAMRYSCVGVLP